MTVGAIYMAVESRALIWTWYFADTDIRVWSYTAASAHYTISSGFAVSRDQAGVWVCESRRSNMPLQCFHVVPHASDCLNYRAKIVPLDIMPKWAVASKETHSECTVCHFRMKRQAPIFNFTLNMIWSFCCLCMPPGCGLKGLWWKICLLHPRKRFSSFHKSTERKLIWEW